MMRDRRFSQSRHVPEDTLIRFLDGELPSGENGETQDHLQACWECRLRADRLSSTILRFVEYCEASIEEHGGFPDTRQEFRMRLREQASSDRPPRTHWLRRMLPQLDSLIPRPGTATAFIAILVVLWWNFFGTSVPSATAEEVLNRSRGLESPELGSRPRVIHQRLELASGTERVEWELWHEPDRNRFLGRWSGATNLSRELGDVYARNRWDEQRPLSAKAFSTWRDSLPHRQEQVIQDAQQIKIQTRATESAPGSIREARLTLRSMDLHPVEQQLVINGANGDREFRIREISFAILSSEEVPAGIFPEEGASGSKSRPGPPLPGPSSSPAVVTDQQLEIAELSVREALHGMGLDTHLIPEFERGEAKVIVNLVAESAEQQERIAESLSRIPYVDARILDPDSPIDWPTQSKGGVTQSPAVRTEPPLNGALIEYFGSLDLTNNYLNQVHRAFRALLVDALALERLSARYPETAREGLDPRSRESLDGIGRDHYAVIARIWPVASELLRPVLEELHKRRALPMGPAHSPECRPVLDSGASVAAHVRQLESAFNSLFVIREQQISINIDTDSTLQNAESLRRTLDLETRYPCRP